MPTINYKQILGILVAIIVLTSGTTLFIKEGQTKTSCKVGFEYVNIGEFEGQYSCTTLSGKRYEVCFEVYNSSNTENNWCKK